MSRPFFSIITPMYDREHLIGRAINSCLMQSFEDFEMIVVDDGSNDRSVEVVKGFRDPRIRLICHEKNRGVGPARNTGIEAAAGEWVVFFDSDDEFLPEALSIVFERSLELKKNISRMQFMGRLDTGDVSPDPPLKNEYWDYVAYLKWMENVDSRRQDTMPILRRETFKKIKFYDDRTLEGPYHLNFMKQFDAWAFPDIVVLYHQDAENQLTKIDTKRTIENAKDQALSCECLLKNHGEALKANAPKLYSRQVSGLATLWFLSGNRLKGVKYSLSSLACNVLSLRNWVILLSGLLGPKPIAWLKAFRTRL